jgi:nucleotide-binding universal stress UspA family protein
MGEIQGTEVKEADHATSGRGDVVARIVVGVDGSPGAVRALDWAGAEAERSGAELTVVGAWVYGEFGGNVFAEEDAQLVVEKAALSVADRYPAVSVNRQLCKESAAHSLIEASSSADLLVVGSRGFGGFRGLLFGSVGQHCLTHAPCSVAIIRTSDEVQTHSAETNPKRIVAVSTDPMDRTRHFTGPPSRLLEPVPCLRWWDRGCSPGLRAMSSPLVSAYPRPPSGLWLMPWPASLEWHRTWSPKAGPAKTRRQSPSCMPVGVLTFSWSDRGASGLFGACFSDR